MITQTYRQGRIDWYFSDFWKQYMLLVWFCSIGFDSITRDNIFHFKRKHKKKKNTSFFPSHLRYLRGTFYLLFNISLPYPVVLVESHSCTMF